MRSNIGARILLVLGFLAASLAYSGWWASRTVFDSAATAKAARTLIATDAVQHDLGDQLSSQLDKQLAQSGADPHVAAAVKTALHDPRVIAAFGDAVEETHAALLGNVRGSITIDTAALTHAVHDALAAQDRKLAARMSPSTALTADIDASKLPSLGHARDLGRTAVWLGTLFAIALIGLSLLLAHDRRSVSRFGRRIAYLALGPLLLFVVVPVVMHSNKGAMGAVAATLETYRGRVLPSALALVGVGVIIAIGALLAPKPNPSAGLLPAAPRPPSEDQPRNAAIAPLGVMQRAAHPGVPPGVPSAATVAPGLRTGGQEGASPASKRITT